jgi:hypothetical protein
LDIAPEHSERTDVQSIAVPRCVLANDQTPPKREGMLMTQLIYDIHTSILKLVYMHNDRPPVSANHVTIFREAKFEEWIH